MGPRRFVPVEAAAPLPLLVAPPPPSPLIQRLRTDWRWAGISQFVWTFSDAFGLLDWDIETLEADLDQDEMKMTPDLIAKMLYALTYNRQINRANAFEHLRKQYAKRAPENLVLGTEEEPREWAALGLGEKVQALWDLCEWQLGDPARFRALLKSEEEAVSWRIEPVGWDKEGNTYFLFDDNRLWVQRQPPLPPAPARPPKKSTQKAKKAQNKKSRPSTNGASSSTPRAKSHKKRAASSDDLTPPPPVEANVPISGPRKRTQVAFYGNPLSTVAALKRGGPAPPSTSSNSKITRSSSRGGLAAAATAETSTPSRTSTKVEVASSTSASRGTRSTRRTRGEDAWQAIPPEWLEEPEASSSTLRAPKKERTSKKRKATKQEVESELSSLPDEAEEADAEEDEVAKGGEDSSSEFELSPAPDDDEDAKEEEVAEAEAEEDAVMEEKGEGEGNADPSAGQIEVDGDAEAKKDEAEAEDVEMKDGEAEGKAEGAEAEAEAEAPKEEVKEEELDEVKLAVKAAADLPEGFVEWEAVCVTLYDWRTFPERFAKSRDPDEKNLYTLLVDAVGPTVIQALVEKEAERLRQEAVNNRKRSSRIATKELEKEELLRRQEAEREMEERMEKSRREERAAAKAQADAASQEKAREDRLKEREERIAARETAAAQKALDEQKVKDKADRARIRRQRRREGETVDTSESEREGSARPSTAKRSRVSTPVVPQKTVSRKGSDEGWELACEICRKAGWNPDDSDVVSCDDCGKWQHTECHDKQDASEGRPKRNWDKVDFKCKECRRKAARKRQRLSNEPRSSPLGTAPPITNGQYNGIPPPINFYPNGHSAAIGSRPHPFTSAPHPAYANQARPALPPISAMSGYGPQYHPQPAQPYARRPDQHTAPQYQQYVAMAPRPQQPQPQQQLYGQASVHSIRPSPGAQYQNYPPAAPISQPRMSQGSNSASPQLPQQHMPNGVQRQAYAPPSHGSPHTSYSTAPSYPKPQVRAAPPPASHQPMRPASGSGPYQASHSSQYDSRYAQAPLVQQRATPPVQQRVPVQQHVQPPSISPRMNIHQLSGSQQAHPQPRHAPPTGMQPAPMPLAHPAGVQGAYQGRAD